MVHVLNYPETHDLWMDFILNPHDGPFWQDGQAINTAHKIKIPAYFQVKWGRGWTVDGTIDCFEKVQGIKRLDLQPLPPMQERPFHESHDEMFRWYDHWLKGIDTGIMDDDERRSASSSRAHGNGARKRNGRSRARRGGNTYLRPRHRLAATPEPLGADAAPPDGFYQAPFTVTSDVQSVKWTTAPLLEDTEMTGPAALYVHVAIDTDDTNLIAKLYDVDPQGNRQVVSSGYLKASHRELDAAQSKPWRPHHPHTRSVPVPPGEVDRICDPDLFLLQPVQGRAPHPIGIDVQRAVRGCLLAAAAARQLSPAERTGDDAQGLSRRRASLAPAAAGDSGGGERRLSCEAILRR